MNLKQELVQLKQDLETKYVIFHNNGRVTEENSKTIFKQNSLWKPFDGVVGEVKDSYERFARVGNQVDSLNLAMDLGVLYKPEDVCEDKLIEGAKPISSLVYYCSEDVDVYTPEGMIDTKGYNEYRVRHYGFMKFSDFVARAKKEGMDYEGPESFEELVTRVKSGEPFKINLSIGLVPEEKIVQEVEPQPVIEEQVQQEVKPVEKKRSLFRR